MMVVTDGLSAQIGRRADHRSNPDLTAKGHFGSHVTSRLGTRRCISGHPIEDRRREGFSLGSYLLRIDYTSRLWGQGTARISREVAAILDRLGTSAQGMGPADSAADLSSPPLPPPESDRAPPFLESRLKGAGQQALRVQVSSILRSMPISSLVLVTARRLGCRLAIE